MEGSLGNLRANIKNRGQALEFYKYFLAHPEYFSEDGVIPDEVTEAVKTLEEHYEEIPEGVEPASSPFLGQVEIAIPIADAIKILESMGCKIFLDESINSKYEYAISEWCMMNDPAGNMFMIVQR